MTILKSDPPWVGSLLCPPSLKGDANGAPRPEASSYAQKFSGKYAYRTINGGIGHNLPQEAPQVFAEAVVEAGGLLNPPKLHGHADETSNMALNLWRSFVNRAARTSSGRTRTAMDRRWFSSCAATRGTSKGPTSSRRLFGTKIEFERFLSPNFRKPLLCGGLMHAGRIYAMSSSMAMELRALSLPAARASTLRFASQDRTVPYCRHEHVCSSTRRPGDEST